MIRSFLATLAIACCFAAVSQAAPPHAWEYMEGRWTYLDEKDGVPATVVWKTLEGGMASSGTWSSTKGKTTELIGWRPDKKVMVADGYGSAGNFWHAEYNQISRERCVGSAVIRYSDGNGIKGDITITKVNADTVTGKVVGSDWEGQPATLGWTWTRDSEN